MKIKPVGYRLTVKPVEVEEKVGNIYLPDDKRDQESWRQCRGEVLDIGELAFTMGQPGTDQYSFKVRPKVGDVVIYREYAGNNLERIAGEPLTLLNDSDVIAIEVQDGN